MKTYRSPWPQGFLVLIAFFFLLMLQMVHADSATWRLNPVTGDWNTAANWMPNTVPNGPTDVATFDVSNQTNVSLSAVTEVESILIQPNSSAFTITVGPFLELTVSGAGIQNDSGSTQTFIQSPGGGTFTNSASPGQMTNVIQVTQEPFSSSGKVQFFNTSSAGHGAFTNQGGGKFGGGGLVLFFDESTAGDAMLTNEGATLPSKGVDGGFIQFNEQSNAGNAVIENKGTNQFSAGGGTVSFQDTSSARNAIITNRGSLGNAGVPAEVFFFNQASADHAILICDGAACANASFGGFVGFHDDSTAADATFRIKGSEFDASGGGGLGFGENSTAGNSRIAVTGGSNGGLGGSVAFDDSSTGGTAQFTVSGNGTINFALIDGPDMTIGSLAGAGEVEMGDKTLFLGGNNLSTKFGGGMTGNNGKLVKEGTGTFELTGPNTYTGGTTFNAGALLANNTTDLATGSGTVQVNAGTLGGSGIIFGPVTLGTGTGTGAFLTPGITTSKQLTLTIQRALIFNSDATYTCTFKAKRTNARSDRVVANGVTINNGASFDFSGTAQAGLHAGLTVTVISNTSAFPINGTFSNLADGEIVNVNGNQLQASYSGGDGNDLTLTVVP
jgi:autotransporter-associated beta strand protein